MRKGPTGAAAPPPALDVPKTKRSPLKFKETDFIGKKFGKLTILKFVGKNKHGWARAQALCDCGRKTENVVSLIKNGRIKTCGCGYRKERDAHHIGRSYGWLTILEIGDTDNYSARKALVSCRCGQRKWLNFYGIRMGRTLSCGCRRRNQLGVTPGLYRCARCQSELPLKEFTAKSRASNGRSGRCKQCDQDLKLKTRYGLTRAEKQLLFNKQGGNCAICESPIQFSSAHTDHVDAQVDGRKIAIVRGLLCGRCNQGIGFLRHSRMILLKAVEYLDNSNKRTPN